MKRTGSTDGFDRNTPNKKRRGSTGVEHTPDEPNNPYEALSEPVQYHCDYCSKDISNTVRIRCAVCQPEFDLCTECFYTGVELRGHQKSHPYRVIDNMHFPFFELNWSADEEQLLLEGLELFGVGNWTDVAEHVSTKDKFACQEHYYKFYMKSPTWPIPDYSQVLATRDRVNKLNSGKYEKTRKPSVAKNNSKKPTPPQPVGQAKSPFIDDLNAYMPLRGEFETEWDNECENHVQDLVFEDNETEEEQETKMKLLEAYNARLGIRYKTRDFVIQKRLHDTKHQEKLAKSRSKEHQEFYNQYKRFLQIMTPEEYENLTLGLATQKILEQKILKYQNYRSKGISTKAEANLYEHELNQREKDKSKGKRRGSKPSRRSVVPLDLEGQPGFQLLSKQEQDLCRNYQVMPQQYMLIKEALLREYLKTGDLTKTTATQLFNIDVDKSGKIFEFLHEVGWINNRVHMTPNFLEATSSSFVRRP